MDGQLTLPEAVTRVARWNEEREAVVQSRDADRRYTYAAFETATDRVAARLAERGIEQGDRVAFLSRPVVAQAIAYHGALKAGAVPVPIHLREAASTVVALLADADPAAIWYQAEFAGLVDRASGELSGDPVRIEWEQAGEPPLAADGDAAAADVPEVDVDPDDDAFVVYTSGTTGRPKGIVHTHAEAVASAHLAHEFYRARRGDVCLNHYTPSFISWHLMTYSFLATGGTVAYMAEWEPAAVPAVMEAEGVTFWLPVTTQWKQVMQAGVEGHDLSSVERVGSGGESMRIDLVREIRDRITPEFIQLYAMTESMLSGCGLFPEEIDERSIASVGKPIGTIDCRIVDPAERDPSAEVSRGDTGEIILRGPSVAERVWDDPERTAELFHEDGWVFTGDLGHRGEEGFLYVDGRRDNMIVSGGINVYPEGVEDALEAHPEIAECAVAGISHDEWGEALKAYIVATGDLTADALTQWCKDNDALASYKRPRAYEFIDELPRTPSGKLDRAALEDRERTTD